MSEKRTLSERKREAILDAAVAEFNKNGFQKTSMDQIAATAQVSKRTVYNHFPSKDLLFQEIRALLWVQALAATRLEYSPHETLAAQLTAIAEQEMDLLNSPSFIALSKLILAECFHSPEMVESNMKQIDQAVSGLNIWLGLAIDDGRLHIDDISLASTQFLALLKSFAYWPQVIGYGEFPDPLKRKKIVESAVAMFLKQYGCGQ